MADPNESLIARAYREFDVDLRVRYTRVGCVLALILMPAGSSLDYFVYPDLFWSVFSARLVCDLILLPLLILLFTSFGRRYVHVISSLWAITPMITICWMIYASEGAKSPYYAGLNLMVIAICQLLPYTLWEALLYCSTVLACYVIACLLHSPKLVATSAFYNNLYFIVLTSIICVTGCYYYTLRRILDFRRRHVLDLRNKQLTELDRLKSQFFANVSHELRTPLTLILAPVDNLLHRDPPLPDAINQTLQLVRQNGLRLLRLINDLLEVVRLEEGELKLRRRRVRLDEFAAGMAESVRGLAQQNALSLEVAQVSEPLTVMADESRLEKVFLNLLTNAIKFTPSGGKICVRWWGDEHLAKVEVADSGIGIDKNDLPYIFDRFHQADGSLTRKFQGLGLGLALAKELVEEHGGRLTATSQVGKGSTFVIELPLATLEEREEADVDQMQSEESGQVLVEMFRAASRTGVVVKRDQAKLEDVGSSGPRVLVVDDEPDMRRFLVSALSDEYAVTQAIDGEVALQRVKEKKPNLVVLDLMLPGMSGVDVCRALRADSDAWDMKILMLTARIDERSKIEALECGVDDFLTKPFSTVEIKTRIRNLLASAALQQDLRARNTELSETLTRLRATEAQLVQSEKMNALGSLAAGLLHEINNPLNFTMLAVQTLRFTMDPADADTTETVDDIEAGMKRIRDIIADLRAFAYPEAIDKQEPFAIQDAIQTAMRFTAQQLDGVEIESQINDGDRVIGSRTHITQVLVNLITNAAYAVESVRSERTPRIKIVTQPNGQRLYVRVQDNGVGMNPDVASRIFDPFFTTREVGQGTGLGLSICHTIVKNHGGRIQVKSEKGHGTEMSFDLPLLAKVESQA